MAPHTYILEKLLVAETAAELGGFANTKRALSEMIAIERQSLLVRGTGSDVIQAKDARLPCSELLRRALGDC